MPPTLELTQDDKYGLEPANVPPASGVTDDKYGLEPASKPTEEQTKALPGATPRLLASPAATGAQRSDLEKNVTGEGISLKGAGTAALEKLKQLAPEDPTGGASPLESRFWFGDQPPSFDPAHGGIAEAIGEAKAGYGRGMEDLRRGHAHPLAPIGEAVTSGLGSLVGVSGEREAEQASHGEGGKIIGEAAVPAGLAAVSPLVEPIAGATGRMAGAFRESVGGALHDPITGEMTKGAEALSRGTGTAVGGATGAGIGSIFGPRGTYAGAGIGATAGSLAGPALMERIFPEPAARIAGREEFARTKTLTEAQESAIKENAARQRAARIENDRLQKAADKARQDIEDARNQHAEDLMRRQREQDKLDDQANKAAREAKAAREKPLEQKAQDLMRRQKEQDALDKAAKKAADDAQAARDQHAENLIRRQKEQDTLDAKHAKALKDLEDARQKELAANEKFKEQHAAALNRRGDVKPMTPPTETGGLQGAPTPFGSPQDLITRTKKLVVPGERPTPEDLKRAGDMTQVPLPRLKVLASFGDELAKNEINRRVRGEPDFSQAPLPRGNVPLTPVKPMTPPRLTVEEKLQGAGVKPWTDIAPQRVSPEELADVSRQLGRPITEAEYPEIRRRLEAERNVAEGIAGNRRDVAGEIREEHRAKLEKGNPEGVLPGMEADVAKQAEGAARVKGEELTAEMNRPRNVEEAAGRMETLSPLFRGTAASPQGELLKPMEKPTVTEPEEEAEPAEVKGVTEPIKQPAKREPPPDVEKKYSRDEIADAEGLIQSEIGMMRSADRPGRYFDESEAGDIRTGSKQIKGGDWRGVTSLRENLPWMSENPKFNPAQLEKALRNKDSALYKKAVDSAAQFIRRSKLSPEERAAAGQERISGWERLIAKPKPPAD